MLVGKSGNGKKWHLVSRGRGYNLDTCCGQVVYLDYYWTTEDVSLSEAYARVDCKLCKKTEFYKKELGHLTGDREEDEKRENQLKVNITLAVPERMAFDLVKQKYEGTKTLEVKQEDLEYLLNQLSKKLEIKGG